MKPFKAIIFDLGNTVFNIDFNEALEYWAKVSHVPVAQIKEKYYYDTQQRVFEQGKLSESAFALHINKMLGINLSFEEFEKGWNSIFLDYVYNIQQLIEGLKGNYTLAVLSNTNLTHAKFWNKKYQPVIEQFEFVFLSHEMGMIKPNLDIYEEVASQLQIAFNEMVFIDDKEENIKAAKSLGIAGICITSSQQAFIELNKFGVVSNELLSILS